MLHYIISFKIKTIFIGYLTYLFLACSYTSNKHLFVFLFFFYVNLPVAYTRSNSVQSIDKLPIFDNVTSGLLVCFRPP